MKKIKTLAIAVLFLFATLSQTGCIGSFKLTNGLYDWNTGLNGKAVQELVFVAFVIIPVYGVTLFIDAIVLNSIEFWGGGNPVSMNEGDEEIQIVERGGIKYQITATKNMFHVEQLTGEKKGQSYNLIFVENESAWYVEANNIKHKVADLNITGENSVNYNLYKPDGTVIQIDPSVTSKNAVKAAISLDIATLE
ncbi:MAG: DUF3332 domain-containing protein [Bacteroidales bacterium]|nr:DUF3332 domain-containing protein [Bacteroidales bacterium]